MSVLFLSWCLYECTALHLSIRSRQDVSAASASKPTEVASHSMFVHMQGEHSFRSGTAWCALTERRLCLVHRRVYLYKGICTSVCMYHFFLCWGRAAVIHATLGTPMRSTSFCVQGSAYAQEVWCHSLQRRAQTFIIIRQYT